MEKIINSLKIRFVNNRFFLLLIFFYLTFRITNILTPPVFNDEAIYLDWGWRETHNVGYLYYSLYDAKQPFLMWIFGIMQHIIPDPLFAGRIVSVFTGLLTLVGIFKISERLFNKNTAFLASILYTIIPIFSFFDRQALMESAISAVGVWTGYFLIKLSEKKSYSVGVVLGVVLGIGFFIKSSALVFLIALLCTTTYLLKNTSKKGKLLEIIFIILSLFTITVLLLIINPEFWKTLSSNSRYTLTFSEILTLPINVWINSVVTNIKILFFYFTPIVFIFSIIGIIQIFKLSNKHKLFLLFFLFCLFFETFFARGATDRYLVSFIPFLTICAAFVVSSLFEKNKKVGLLLITFILIIPTFITLYQLFNFPSYLINMGKISGYSNSSYLTTNTSGYGIKEAIEYFKKIIEKENIVIGIAQNTGNPESGLQIYFRKETNPRLVYFDASLFQVNVNDYDCLVTGAETYFVARDNQQAGLEKFFVKINTINNPYGENTIGIFKLKKECKGKALRVEIIKKLQ